MCPTIRRSRNRVQDTVKRDIFQAKLILQIFLHCQITRESAEQNSGRKDDRKDFEETAHIIFENIEADKIRTIISVDRERNDRKKYEDKECGNDSAENPARDERTFDIFVRSTDKSHDGDFIFRHKNGQANGIKCNGDRNEDEKNCQPQADFIG